VAKRKARKDKSPDRLSLRKLREDGSVMRDPPKPGRVVRLDRNLAGLLAEIMEPGETVSSAIRRLIEGHGRTVETYFVLPSSLYRTIEDARGAAVLAKIQRGLQRTEKPVAVMKEE
jgi:hypothetical protein